MVTHPALQLERARPGIHQQRRARMAQGVEADPRHAGALSGGSQHAVAEVVGIEPRSAPAGEDGCIVGGARRPKLAELVGEVVAEWNGAVPVARFRRTGDAFDDRAAYAQP